MRRKFLKLAIGVSISVAGGYIIANEGIAAVSETAVVNARVLVVRSPIDGLVELKPLTVGQNLHVHDVLGSIRNERADDARLQDFLRTAKALESEISLLEAQTRLVFDSRSKLVSKADIYQAGRIRQLEAGIAEAKALHGSARATLRELGASYSRAEELKSRGIQSEAVLDKALAGYKVAALEAQAAEARLEKLSIELEAAAKGTFLGDSYNDTPYSSQRTLEMNFKIGELRAQLDERRRRLSETRDLIAIERARHSRMSEAILTSPVKGHVWAVLLDGGEYARQGQDLLRLLDCSSTIVTASVGERVYNRLRVGDPAWFRLAGTARSYEGVVLRLAGSGASAIYSNLAIAPGSEQMERYDVALAMPALASDPDIGCAVGRTGKVMFASREKSMVTLALEYLGLL